MWPILWILFGYNRSTKLVIFQIKIQSKATSQCTQKPCKLTWNRESRSHAYIITVFTKYLSTSMKLKKQKKWLFAYYVFIWLEAFD